MIKITSQDVVGFEPAIRGMRNAYGSWDKSDSKYEYRNSAFYPGGVKAEYIIGPNDLKLMKTLIKSGSDHRKFMRMIHVYCDVVGPLYWWKEMDTYRFGVEKNSTSTMHSVHKKMFTMGDFSCELLMNSANTDLYHTVDELNVLRDVYLDGGSLTKMDGSTESFGKKDKRVWDQIIQLLPSSYNQLRTLDASYEALYRMYNARKNHKLKEWREFCKFISKLPYFSELADLEKGDS